MSTKISLTRALKEIEILERRIIKASNEADFVGLVKGKKLPVGIESREQMEAQIKASSQSVTSLIERRNTIKARVLRANSTTQVEVGSETMTIAEAIDRRNHGLALDKQLLASMKNDFANAVRTVERENLRMEEVIERMASQALGSKDAKVDKDQYEAIAAPYRKQHETKLVDPLGLKARIESMATEIEDFEMNVDFALSEINARTEIELD